MSFRGNVANAPRLAAGLAPQGMTPLTAFAVFAGAILVVAMIEFLFGGVSLRSPYGIHSIIAATTVETVAIVVLARIDSSSRTIRNLVLLHLVAMAIAIVEREIAWAWHLDPRAHATLGTTIGIALSIRITRGARHGSRVAPGVGRPILRVIAFTIASIVLPLSLPVWPVVAPEDYSGATANHWEIVRYPELVPPEAPDEAEKRVAELRAAERTAARLEARQSALLSAAVDALETRDPSAANVFAIGVAGWGDQDVFMLETQQSLDILRSRFHLGTRVLSLVNNADTADERPMASMQNIAAALRAVGARMNPDKDVLILTMTSHGSPDGFALRYGDFVERTLDPKTLKILLDESGIKNRIIIVSSCYSGSFVAPLMDGDTAIITAASSTHTSFGCANDRKWTYFGEAFFENGLTGKATIADAFASAKATVAAWEREQRLTPSDPQIAIGERIARRFPDLIGGSNSAAAVAAEAEPAPANRE